MSTEDRECCICFEEIGAVNNCTTECGHVFCFKCLAIAMYHKNACPCCRSRLVDVPDEQDEISDYEDDDDEDDDEDEDLDDEGHVEDIVERLEKNGMTMIDVVSMLLNRYSKKDAKYTEEHIMVVNMAFDKIATEVDAEHMERLMFAEEDTREREKRVAMEGETIVFRPIET